MLERLQSVANQRNNENQKKKRAYQRQKSDGGGRERGRGGLKRPEGMPPPIENDFSMSPRIEDGKRDEARA